MGARIYTAIVSVGDINIYQVGSSPNGALEAPQGSLAVRNDTAEVWQNTDGSTAWTQLGGGGSFEYDTVTELSAASGDLSAEPTRNIAYNLGASESINQTLPSAAGSRKLYRFMCFGGDESDVQFAAGGGDTIEGRTSIQTGFGFDQGIVYISDGVDTWYGYPGFAGP